MLLRDIEIKDLMESKVLTGASSDRVQNIAYDLTTKCFYSDRDTQASEID